VEINRADALELGVKSGDLVRLSSRRGSTRARWRSTDAASRRAARVFVPFFDESKLVNG
jgi:anaerobic selenocysteine-containing dehydrogenase